MILFEHNSTLDVGNKNRPPNSISVHILAGVSSTGAMK